MSERDTHFLGFARLLVDEIQLLGFEHRADFETYIAQRAYDFAEHVLEAIPDLIPEVQSLKAAQDDIPDMTAWPEREGKG